VSESVLRALVVEDEWIARQYLVELLERTKLAVVVGAVATSDDATALLEKTDLASGVDVAFVDINLLGSSSNGLALVRDWANREGAPAFVLATAMHDRAVEAFDLGVVDYLTKPFTLERTRQCLERIGRSAPARAAADRLVARNKRSLVFLDADEIWAFESQERLTLVHTAHGVFDVDLSLQSLESTFGGRFRRVHRNWLVATQHIRVLDRDAGETWLFVGVASADERTGVRVPVARDRAQAVRDWLLTTTPGVRKR
jgi:two-component system, LytTR family, response regulator LytT